MIYFRNGATTTFLAFALVATSAGASAGRIGEDDALRAGLPSIGEQARYRAELGMPATHEAVRELNARWAAGALPGATVEGAVFSAEEERELDAREDAAHEIARVARTYFHGDRESAFGGVFIDHQTGRTVVQVTRDAESLSRELRARVANEERLTVTVVPHALSDLERIVDDIAAMGPSLRGDGFEVAGATVDERANVVRIGVRDSTGAVRKRILDRLGSNDAARVRFEDQPQSSFTGVDALNAPPVKGGQRIVHLRTDGLLNQCTSAFDAYLRTRTDAGVYVYDRYMLTAGHCKLEGVQGAGWFQTELYYIGVADRDTLSSGLDTMRVPLSKPLDRSQLVAITATHDRYIYGRQAETADVVGERVCMSGATTGGELCGTLLSRTYADTIEGISLRSLRIASFSSRDGDSGGSILSNSTAKGIVSCRTYYNNADRACYQHVHTALRYLGLTDVEGV